MSWSAIASGGKAPAVTPASEPTLATALTAAANANAALAATIAGAQGGGVGKRATLQPARGTARGNATPTPTLAPVPTHAAALAPATDAPAAGKMRVVHIVDREGLRLLDNLDVDGETGVEIFGTYPAL